MGSEWQPIETAPKDGSAILLYAEYGGYPSCEIAEWVLDQWCHQHDSSFFIYGATHWMPLPGAPT